jgi:TonB family protein
VFPDPAIYPWQLPKGLQGDVIVEVTIDEQGSVTNTRVLQSLQQDIDEKVIATLRSWRFKPATVDGAAISSRARRTLPFPQLATFSTDVEQELLTAEFAEDSQRSQRRAIRAPCVGIAP